MSSPTALPAVLHVDDLHKKFGARAALDGVSFELRARSSLVVIGPSGSGKSTLLRCINWLERPTSGHVHFEGKLFGEEERGGVYRPLPPRTLAAQRARMGMVFQQFNLFPHLTALRNVALGPQYSLRLSRRAAEERAHSYLAQVGLGDRGDSYPSELSGGQQQRVGIARALAMEPKLLLFDEPTSALDPELIGEVLDVITALAERHMTMIVVTHEMNFARRAGSWLMFMDEGRIIEQGEPHAVLDSPRVERTQRFLRQITHR